MRLLHTEALKLEEFFDSKIPPYAILSHRWEDGEVTFKDVIKGRNDKAPGWSKIEQACTVARKRKQDWMWIDTCCIDKRSSAELSEAINSMYRWYQNAVECYAYLNDVTCQADGVRDFTTPASEMTGDLIAANTKSEFRSSKWFTRGWTLQELIASRTLLFIDKQWTGMFGTKRSLARLLVDVTKIEELYHYPQAVGKASVAKRMSWAAHRECSRPEDLAYCLLGIFEISMPLLYGEGGPVAFRRLQLEIMKQSNDESIFAWDPEKDSGWKNLYSQLNNRKARCPMLASTPAMFSGSSAVHDLSSTTLPRRWLSRAPFSMTNRGLAIQTVISDIDFTRTLFAMPLYCFEGNKGSDPECPRPLAIYLTQTAPQEYVRVFWRPEKEVAKGSYHPWTHGMIDYQRRLIRGRQESIIVAGPWFPASVDSTATFEENIL